MIVCITGTNTDVGKTVATAALASAITQAGAEVVAAKPIQTGEAPGQGDAAVISALAGVPTFERWRYPEPLAPNVAARRARRTTPPLGDVAAWVRGLNADNRVVLVEGAGGLLVRLGGAPGSEYTLADIARELDAPLVVVTSLGLGSLNLAELTCVYAHSRGLAVAGLIGGMIPADPDLATRLNVEELPRVTGVPYWGSLPVGAGSLGADPAHDAGAGNEANEAFAAMAWRCLQPAVAALLG